MNNKIIYGIIILCIIGIILVFVFSTGYKVLDWFLVGIFASGVYLINKNTADNENLDPEISNKIATDRDIAINGNFHHDFVREFIESDDKELDGEKLDEDALKTLKTLKTYDKFLSKTNNYLNNNELSIKNYFTQILPLFKNTEKNTDDLKKNIIKYVVFYYFTRYNKKGVVIPHNYKILVDLYIKDNTYINNKNTAKVAPDFPSISPSGETKRNFDNELDEYIQRKHKEITDPVNFLKKYNIAVELKDMQNDLWHYFHNYDGKDISNDIIRSPDTTNKLKTIYKGLNNENAKNRFINDVEILLPKGFDNKDEYIKNLTGDSTSNFIKDVEILLPKGFDNKDEYIKNLTGDSTSNFIKDVENNKEDNTELNNKMIKIKNYVDGLLSGQRNDWRRPDYTNLQALTPFARNHLNNMYNEFKTDYEKDILIAYIKELLKDVEEKDVEDIIKGIKKLPSYGNNFHLN